MNHHAGNSPVSQWFTSADSPDWENNSKMHKVAKPMKQNIQEYHIQYVMNNRMRP